MRILFVSTNRLKRIMPPMPLGLASVIAQIDESRHEIQVLDLMFAERPEAELKARLASFSPDLVALSIRNVDNQSYQETEYLLPEDKKVVEWCREASAATLVVGGTAFTVSPVAILEYLDADFGIAGEGEIAFRELEIEMAKQAATGAHRVIACGGGVVLNKINTDRLRETSRTVYLATSPGTVLERTSRGKNERPLLAVDDPASRIGELMEFRRPFYERAADRHWSGVCETGRESGIESLAVLDEVCVPVLVARARDECCALPSEGLRPIERLGDTRHDLVVDDVVAGVASRAEYDRVGQINC